MNKNQPYYIHTTTIHQKRINTMIYYLFPRASISVNKNTVKVVNTSSTTETPYLSFSLRKYMEEINHKIENMESWTDQISNHHRAIEVISKIKHVSFIFYELIELYHLMNLGWDKYTKMTSLHIGKDANTTIKMCQFIRKQEQTEDEYCTVYPSNYSPTILHYFYQAKYNSIDLVIYSACDTRDEYQNCIDLLKQLCIGLGAQKKNSTCIIKYGDTFSQLSLHILYFLSHFFEKMFFIKPYVSDLSKGDKFIVCKHFIYDGLTDKMNETIIDLFHKVSEEPSMRIEQIIQHTIPLFVSSKLEEINSIFGQSRLEHIQHLLTHQQNWHSEKANTERLQKSKEWCLKYNVPYNNLDSLSTNF